MMNGWGWHSGMGTWGTGGGIITLLLIVALVVGGIYLFRKNPRDNKESETEGLNLTPEEALKQRYAKGEISREEYQRIKSDLEDRTE